MVICDQLGKLVTKNRLADLVPEENLKRAIFNINTGNRRIINKVHKNQDKVIWRESVTEMDNNADTHCFVAKFGTSLDGYDSFINVDEEGIAKGDPNEEGYQGPPDSPDIDAIIYNSDEERAANSYDQ